MGLSQRVTRTPRCTQERELTPLKEWTHREIEARRERLLAWARHRWHVEPSAAPADITVEENERDEVDDIGEVA
jgi:hypothetical protein